MFDKDITVVNKWTNPQTKNIEYKTSHIHGFWSSNEGISMANSELIKNDGLIVRILMSETRYVSPKEFEDSGNGWTLKNDDYLVKGVVDSVSKIADLKSNYECMKITNVAKKDYGSSDMQHFEVSGE